MLIWDCVYRMLLFSTSTQPSRYLLIRMFGVRFYDQQQPIKTHAFIKKWFK